MIYHIIGNSGSGKTTLGKNIIKIKNKNIIVIDTDDIDDHNSIKIVNKYSLDNKKSWNDMEKELSKMNKKDMEKILKNNKDKIIIFVGFFHAGMNFMNKKVDKTFHIKIDPETLWKQYNMRSATAIHKNYNEIMKLLNNKMHIDKKYFILSKKFGIRGGGFTCRNLENYINLIKYHEKIAKEQKHFYDTSKNILKEIKKIIK